MFPSWLCTVLSLIASLTQAAGDASSYVELVRVADAALEGARLEEARRAFDDALELAPQNPTCLYGQACVAARAGRLEESVAWLERAVKHGFDDAALARWDPDLGGLREAQLLEPVLESFSEQAPGRDRRGAGAGVVWSCERAGGFVRAPSGARRDFDFRDLPAEPWRPAFVPDGARVAIPCGDGTVRILELASGRAAMVLRSGEARLVRAVFSPDGDLLATAGHDGRVRLWDAETGGERSSFAAYEEQGFHYEESGDPSPGPELAFDRAGGRVLTFGAGPRAMVWRLDGGEPIAFPHAGATTAAWSPDGARVAIGSSGGSTRFFDPDTGQPAGPELVHRGAAVHLAFHPRGKLLATGARVLSFSHEDHDVFGLEIACVAFDPSGERLVTTSRAYAAARGWTVANGELLWTIAYNGGNPATLHARFQADGRRLFLSGNNAATTRVVDPLDGSTIRDLAGEGPVDLVPSPDGRWVVGVVAMEVRVLDGLSLALRHTVVPVTGGWQLLVSPSGYVDGDADALQMLHATRGEASLPSAYLVGALFDPKKVRAASAGVATTPPRIPAPPTLQLEAPDGRIAIPRGGLVLRGEMEDALGLAGLAIDTADEADAMPARSEIEWLDEGHTRARFTLHVSPPPPAIVRSLDVCAIGRSGLSSRTSRLTVFADER